MYLYKLLAKKSLLFVRLEKSLKFGKIYTVQEGRQNAGRVFPVCEREVALRLQINLNGMSPVEYRAHYIKNTV